VADGGARRRTFAIISHPDAGKTTLTEKLLLYGGAIHLAGSVKARRAARHATSDWMKLEQERGISVTSSVLQFDYAGRKVNLLDTPGHADFSEDTYRTLIAADSAVMLLDNRRGVEERTRQLFEVCHKRRTPIFTFVNKCDRAGEDPLKLLDDVERDLGITLAPVTWPIFDGDKFVGVYDRLTQHVYLFERGEAHGSEQVATIEGGLDAPEIAAHASPYALDKLREDLELLDVGLGAFDRDAFMAGELSPGVLRVGAHQLRRRAVPARVRRARPGPRAARHHGGPGRPRRPVVRRLRVQDPGEHGPQAPRPHGVRARGVGALRGGMDVTLARTGKSVRLSAPQSVMARERQAIDEAFPGDVVGIVDKGTLRIGDTLVETAGKNPPTFRDIPRFPPETFVRVLSADPMRRKQLDTGLKQLSEEGAAQVFFAERDAKLGSGPSPIVGAIGQLQFDVMSFRLETEYGAPAKLEPLGYGHPRLGDRRPQGHREGGHGARAHPPLRHQGEPDAAVRRPVGDALGGGEGDQARVPRGGAVGDRRYAVARRAPGGVGYFRPRRAYNPAMLRTVAIFCGSCRSSCRSPATSAAGCSPAAPWRARPRSTRAAPTASWPRSPGSGRRWSSSRRCSRPAPTSSPSPTSTPSAPCTTRCRRCRRRRCGGPSRRRSTDRSKRRSSASTGAGGGGVARPGAPGHLPGEAVAVKVLRPGVERRVRRDLAAAARLLRFAERRFAGPARGAAPRGGARGRRRVRAARGRRGRLPARGRERARDARPLPGAPRASPCRG
jgi:peptide chain release factor 3